ncbi:MAG: proton-conducting transporter membrane subunit [Elusimicrobia bacterium]|nr:proton-conducting transporter membrane subunit [Elusimicrobiota bacterium]
MTGLSGGGMLPPLRLLWPQCALAAGVLFVLAAGAVRRAAPGAGLKAASLAFVAAALALLAPTPEAASAPLLGLDALGRSLQGVFFAAALPLLYVMEPADEVPPALVLAALVGMGLIAVSANLLTLFLGLETMSLPAYLLVSRSRSATGLEAAVKYFFAGSTASAFFLMGMALHYAAAGSLALGAAPGGLGGAGLALMGAAALFKLGAVPLHFWLPDVYEASDPELAGFFSTALKAAAVLLLARLASIAPAGAFAAALPWAASLTILFGAVAALRQTNLARLLAYSSISHVGFMMLAVAAWARGGRVRTAEGALFFYLAVYVFMSGGAFLWLRTAGISSRRQLRGLARARPAQAAALAALLLALAGIPPTAGFAAKFLVFWEALKAGLYAPMILGGLGAVVALGYYLGLIRDMYFDPPDRHTAPAQARPARGWGVVAAFAGAAVLLGLTPWLVNMPWRAGAP